MKTLKSIGRGILKSLPGGNPIIEALKNKQGVVKEVITESGEAVNAKISKPHDWVSIITQALTTGLIIWAIASGKLSLEQIQTILNLF